VKASEVFESVTAEVIRSIESGMADPAEWRPPWRADNGGIPCNVTTGKPYRGGNIMALWVESWHCGYERPLWATYKQYEAAGGQVRKGEHGCSLVKWVVKRPCREHPNGRCSKCSGMFPTGFTVFNVGQVEGFEVPADDWHGASDADRSAEAERFLGAVGADVRHAPGRAFYAPVADYVSVPSLEDHRTAADYYATVGHELVHWTGHESRTNRTFGKVFGDEGYAAEELVAELGSAFLAAMLGTEPEGLRIDHAQYLAHWVKMLRAEPRALFDAAGKAQTAVDFLSVLAGDREPVTVDA
jgi:antirestriction protein ArdC